MTRLYSVEIIGLTKRAAFQTLYDGSKPVRQLGASGLSTLSVLQIFDFGVDMML
ncbi:unnamed protein product [Penicillium camemberti]|uniref:Str. FM013 n=1 Tax=Penicillium camemberti (strain FM 013) TaxID=1429867 RepID=A0A0G4NWY4_PENC3|nr:unnamed protein product [Penicillium camemberti]